ncbi:MAG: hypothetical protein JWN72_1357 [Thermoleophilia bacterium]|nr:hypothetical protein [Thermoleophilia bacterium]
MIRNVQGHRIRWRVLGAQGAAVGLWSAVAMLVVAMATVPLFDSSMDTWSFTKVIASGILGDGAASPVTGFELVPVLVGTLVHLTIGLLVGVSFAFVIGFFDLEGWTPVALVGLLYGALLFVGSATFVNAGLGPWSDVPLQPLLWGNVVFGLVAGLLMSTWAQDADIDIERDEPVHVFETSFTDRQQEVRGERPAPTWR